MAANDNAYPQDGIDRYMAELRDVQLLDRAEEHRLAVRYLDGDQAAGRLLVHAHLRLVVKLAHEYHRGGSALADLVQEGNLGLVQALRKYDPHRGVRLSSYASWWIRAYMLRFILDNARLVRLGTTPAQRKLFFNLRKERDRLERAGFVATPAALAQAMDVPEGEVRAMQERLAFGETSLDTPAGDGDERTPLDRLPDGAAPPDELLAARQRSERVRASLEEFARGLSGRDATIFRERLLAEAPRTLQEIGDRYSISRERARQLEKHLLQRLRGFLKRELGALVDEAA